MHKPPKGSRARTMLSTVDRAISPEYRTKASSQNEGLGSQLRYIIEAVTCDIRHNYMYVKRVREGGGLRRVLACNVLLL